MRERGCWQDGPGRPPGPWSQRGYLLAGLGFAGVYQAIAELAPESFALPAATGEADGPGRLEVQLIYFSHALLPVAQTVYAS